MAYRTVKMIAANYGLTLGKNERTDDLLEAVVKERGGFDQLLATMREMRSKGIGWQKMAAMIGLNRYACRILVEKGQAPTFRNCVGRKRWTESE
ncbi:MAG TPA: hypothetical protein VD902_09385 [Symbiobacteriaceae bacterium]|nr:hypothetical protein [Symbiobacteriaceae bacterium]